MNPSLDILSFNMQRSANLLAAEPSLRKFALTRLVGGINFVQFLEFRLALENLQLDGSGRVLDIASPKLKRIPR